MPGPAQTQVHRTALTAGPFLGLNTTRSPFYLQEGDGVVASNTDISISPGDMLTSAGRQLVAKVELKPNFVITGVSTFTSFVGSEANDGSIQEVVYLVYGALDPTTGDQHGGYVRQDGTNVHIGGMNAFTQAEQFGDALFTNGGDKLFFDGTGVLLRDDWQIQADKRLTYNATGQAISVGSGSGGTFQYAYTVRKSAHWRTSGGPQGTQASLPNGGSVTCAADGFVSFSLVKGSQTFTTAQVQFTRTFAHGKYQISIQELSDQVCAELVQTINGDPQIGQMVTAYVGNNQHSVGDDNSFSVYVNKAGSDGNNYSGYVTITNTGNGNSAAPSTATQFTGGQDQGGGNETILKPDLSTYQESSPIITPQFVVATDGTHEPCFVVPNNMQPSDLISGKTTGGEDWYGVLYRSSELNPTFVFVDYLINLNQATVGGQACFKDPYTDTQIQNNTILELHQDPPPIFGQVFPGPAFSTISGNSPNGAPPESFEENDKKVSFTYTNPATIAKHQTRMFLLTLYPTEPTKYQTDSPWRNRLQLQPQLWYSNYGIPWSYDDVQQLVLVGAENGPGNYQIDVNNGAPWSPSATLNDIPVGMASTGSILAVFKRRSGWILFGDSPAEFQQGLREAFDIGAVSQNSITAAEGGVFWLCDRPLGFYFFNGAAPSYVSEDIRDSLGALSKVGELSLCAAGYGGEHIYYASWPASTNPLSPAYQTGITFCYSVTEQKWFTLPYGSSVTFRAPLDTTYVGIAYPNPTEFANYWDISYLQASVQDLGTNVEATWQTGNVTGLRRGTSKIFKEIILTAPTQQADVQVQLFIDGVANPEWTTTWNLDGLYNENATNIPWSRVFTLPDSARGYSASLTLTLTNRSTTVPASVYSCDITYEEKSGLQSTASFDGTYTNVSP